MVLPVNQPLVTNIPTVSNHKHRQEIEFPEKSVKKFSRCKPNDDKLKCNSELSGATSTSYCANNNNNHLVLKITVRCFK